MSFATVCQGLASLLPSLPAEDIRTLLVVFEEEATRRQIHHLRQIRGDTASRHHALFSFWKNAARDLAAARANISHATYGEPLGFYPETAPAPERDGYQSLKGGQFAAPVAP